METKDLRDLVLFSPDGPARNALFESDHLWSQVVCLERTHELGPITDPDADAIVLVVAGEVSVQVDRSRARAGQWEATLVPAGSELFVRNASTEPAVLLVVAAPPPTPRPPTE